MPRSKQNTEIHRSAIDVVSDEVLEFIFFSVTEHRSEELDACHIPALNQVNRHWRHMSTASPRLWRNLGNITIDSRDWKSAAHGERIMQRLTIFLQRSHPHPISFSFHGWRLGDVPIATRIFSQLCDSSSRWEDVTLTLCSPLLFKLKSISGRVPLLQNVRIKSALVQDRPQDPFELDWFEEAPMLRSFDLSLKAYGRQVHLSLPWSQLEYFGRPDECCIESVGILDGPRPKLKSLEFVVNRNLFALWNPAFPWQFKNLTSFRVRFRVDEYLEILSHLHLPNLTELSVEAGDPQRFIQGVAMLIEHSTCVLRSLSLVCGGQDWQDSDGHLRLLIDSCPTLLELQIGRSLISAISYYLTTVDENRRPPTPSFVPRLRALTVCGRHHILLDVTQHGLHSSLPGHAALNAMAVARAGMHSDHSKVTPRLRLRVQTSDLGCPDISHDHSLLDNLPHVPAFSEPLEELWQWRIAVRSAESCLDGWQKRFARILLFSVALRRMEEYEVNVLNMRRLCAVNLPGLLHHLLSVWQSVKTENGTQKMSALDARLQKRMKALLDKWRPLLIEDARANRRWSRNEREYMEYIDDVEKAGWTDDEKVWAVVLSGHSKKHHMQCPGYKWPLF